jgi:tetratricopeptide (TPR) repeat protein/predicted MPP superfamily phosphohydrolase
MTGLTWLHLSDWHQKGTEFDREVVLEALLKDIKRRTEINESLAEINFAVFSGDLAFGGKKEEYQTAKEILLDPLLEASGLKSDRLFIVPGNHDLDREELKLLSPEFQKPIVSEAEEQEWLTNERRRKKLQDLFWAFSEFVIGYTEQDSPAYADTCIWRIKGKKIALLGLNSALGCERNEIEKGSLIVGEPQIREALKGLDEADIKIAVLHHPFDWLAEFDFIRVERPLRSNCDFILCGHTHMPRVEASLSTKGNAVIIPAGASYRKRIEKSTHYTSSYNFVHLDFDTGAVSVFLRRWNDERGEWVEDIGSYPDGQFDFELPKIKSKNKPGPTIPFVAPVVPVVPRQIPPPPSDFKGREDEIRDILSNFEKGATITGLRGMGGVGKTALALVLADKIKSKFPDGQIFIEMRGTSRNPDMPPMRPDEAMAHVIRAFNPVDKLPENSNELRGLYHSILAGKRVLMLLDNAAGSEQVEPLQPPEGCCVLITSRIKFALPGLAEKDLDILPSDKARELLLAIAPRIGNRADDLAKLCGCLPIALRNAGKALAEKKDLGVSEYERRLRDKVERLELVKASFSTSYDLLTTGRKKQWRRLSVFPEDFDRNAAIAILKMAPGPSAEALSDLVRWSLVDFVPGLESEDGRYKLHDLARLFAESCLKQDELADAQQKHAKYYLKVLSQVETLYKKGEMNLLAGLDLFDREWANIKVGQSWVRNIIRNSGKTKKSDLKFALQLASSYASNAMNVLDLRLHPRDSIEWYETGLLAAKMMGIQGYEGLFLGNLGGAYTDLGEVHKAIEYYEHALAIAREIGDKCNEGAWLGNIGSSHYRLGEARKALEYYEQTLSIYCKIGNIREEGITLGNMGLAYYSLGEVRKALEYYEQALAIYRKTGNMREEGSVLINFGLALTDLGEVRQALKYYDQALAIASEIGDRRKEGAALENMGLAYSDLGEIGKAIEYHELALAIAHEIGDRRNEGAALENMGLAYSDLGEISKAIEYHELALAIAHEIGNRQNEGEELCNLGKAYLDLNETSKAIEYCMQSLDIVRKIEYRKIEGEALCTLGKVYSATGEIEKALDHYDQALKIFIDMEYRQGEGDAMFCKSQALDKLNRRPQAIDCAQKALQIFEQIESPKAEEVRQKLAEWHVSGPQES